MGREGDKRDEHGGRVWVADSVNAWGCLPSPDGCLVSWVPAVCSSQSLLPRVFIPGQQLSPSSPWAPVIQGVLWGPNSCLGKG